MTTATLHPLAADYLERLERSARGLPRAERRELLEEISAHLAEATDPDMSQAEVLTVLDRLGDPEDIVEAQRPDEAPRPDGIGGFQWAAILLLLFGGFIFVVGWIAGVVMLWSSRAWRVRDKLIGTLIVPGGLASAVYVGLFAVGSSGKTCKGFAGGPQHCTGGAGTGQNILDLVLFFCLLLAPICTALYLARKAR